MMTTRLPVFLMAACLSSCATTAVKAPSLQGVEQAGAAATQSLQAIQAALDHENGATEAQIHAEHDAAEQTNDTSERTGHVGILRALSTHLQELQDAAAELGNNLAIKKALDDDFTKEASVDQDLGALSPKPSPNAIADIAIDKDVAADANAQVQAAADQGHNLLDMAQVIEADEARIRAIPVSVGNETPEEVRVNQQIEDAGIDLNKRLLVLYTQLSRSSDISLRAYGAALATLASAQESALQ